MNLRYKKRFGGIGRLYGTEALDRLQRAHVCVVGLGGVGSWAVEALARSGIGEMTLVDLDDICISNVNRQLHALEGALGKPKVEVMAERVKAINPDCQLHALHSFLLKSNAREIIRPGYDAVLDAIDSPSLKAVLIATCRDHGQYTVTTGGAAGRQDPTKIEVIDLAFSSHDRLMQHVRRLLRRRHGFPRGDQAFEVDAVISREQQVFPTKGGSVCTDRRAAADLRLDCHSGFGTASFITGTFGFVAASLVVKRIAMTGSIRIPEKRPGSLGHATAADDRAEK
jgi:tRNA threonylcarbamoyladenosine dehydratase